ncbi:MAG: hypothetical protein LBQ28_07915 [Prevotellaceae bacterium]|jgi:hypothetical protein|nr:hypothetical protein [Prevotellaceae bacterium]
MKLLALLIMLAALYLLYRIAYPKQMDIKKSDAIPEKEEKADCDVMGKSRFVLPDRSQPQQSPATILETEKANEKADIFATETEEQQSAAISADELDEVFGENVNPEILSIPLDDSSDDDDIDYASEEETEELNMVLGNDAALADGFDYDELQSTVKIVKEQPETVDEKTGRIMVELEHTDMFEMLVSGNESKMNWIKSVIDRQVQSMIPETENETSDIDYGNFDIADFLS